jgi:uncharacterized protein
MKFGLSNENIQKINAVFEKYSALEKVLIFGSRAKGNYREGSDIDLSLFGEALFINDITEIGSKLDELNLPYQFDLVLYSAITNPDFTEHINRVGKLFYEKQKANPTLFDS